MTFHSSFHLSQCVQRSSYALSQSSRFSQGPIALSRRYNVIIDKYIVMDLPWTGQCKARASGFS